VGLTNEMILVLAILALTLYLFISEVVRTDVAAMTVLVLLGVAGLVPGDNIFVGFSSTAVITIMAVMVMASGLDRTGVMGLVARLILKLGGSAERRIVPLISIAASVVSSLMPNIGAAALFLPVSSRVSTRTGIPLSRLLMPVGFCTMLGGTLTMIGSSPLILLNDLVAQTVAHAGGGVPVHAFGMVEVAPVGLALVVAGVVFLSYGGRRVLPVVKAGAPDPGATARYFEQTYGIRGEIFEATVPPDSPLVGTTIGALEALPGTPFILGVRVGNEVKLEPGAEQSVSAGMTFALMGGEREIRAFRREMVLDLRGNLETFLEVLNPALAGISEVVIPPGSNFAGRTLMDIGMRQRYGANVLAIYREEESIRKDGISETVLRVGDTLVLHSRWDKLGQLARNKRNVLVITDFPHEVRRPQKVNAALLVFTLAIGLALFADMPIALALFVGATGMVLTRVLSIDEAYRAISWQTVFLLACLLPLGSAVESSGLATWFAGHVLFLLSGAPAWVLQTALAVITTILTLIISNVGATVLLVPVAMRVAIAVGADPSVYALTVGIAASNSFVLPTHQVNALIMGPAGYKARDFLVAGGAMTVIYLVVMMVMMNVVF